MANRYPSGSKKKRKSKEPVNIPIYYRLPGPGDIEILTGYLEKENLSEDEKSKRFFGHFQCKNCRQQWHSGYAWQGYQQECKKCKIYEWPFKVYHLEDSQHEKFLMKKPHLSSLCEKCQKDGVHCLTGETIKPDTEKRHETKFRQDSDNKYSRKNKQMIHFEKQFHLDAYGIIVEPQFFQELFDKLWDILSREGKSEFKEALNITVEEWRTKGREDLAIECKKVLNQTRY